MLAERFGGGPEMYYTMPADRRQYWLALLGVEGEVAEQFAGENIDDVVFYDDDD